MQGTQMSLGPKPQGAGFGTSPFPGYPMQPNSYPTPNYPLNQYGSAQNAGANFQGQNDYGKAPVLPPGFS